MIELKDQKVADLRAGSNVDAAQELSVSLGSNSLRGYRSLGYSSGVETSSALNDGPVAMTRRLNGVELSSSEPEVLGVEHRLAQPAAPASFTISYGNGSQLTRYSSDPNRINFTGEGQGLAPSAPLALNGRIIGLDQLPRSFSGEFSNN